MLLFDQRGKYRKEQLWVQFAIALLFLASQAKTSIAFTPLQRTSQNCIKKGIAHGAIRRNIEIKNCFFFKDKTTKTFSLFGTEDENDVDLTDDGWGETKSNIGEKERELASLRSQIDSKKANPSSTSYPDSGSGKTEGKAERDLFIPIFAVVSLLGLFGAYGYEMLRLYSRGELYLPGM